MIDNRICHCDSTLPFSRCCGPIISGATLAVSAKQLMRSRFSAFCRNNIDYLIATHHPSQRQSDDRMQLAETLNECEWLNLTIIDTQQRDEQLQDEVEFVASYQRNGKNAVLHERSNFIKEQGKWFYLDGNILETPPNKSTLKKQGRNDPCQCGSGKKYKHCHGQ